MVCKDLQSTLTLCRTALGMTQAQAAERIGCSLRTYLGWEHGAVTPLPVWEAHIDRFVARAHLRTARGAK